MDSLKAIGARIKSLREIFEMTTADVSKEIGVPEDDYIKIEDGKKDFPASVLIRLSALFNVDSTDILTGDSPKLSTYAITRKNKGMTMQRRKGFEYENLAHNFRHRIIEPLYVKAPFIKEEQTQPIALSSHDGQEYDYILSGTLKVQVNDKIEILEKGDSIYYNSSNPHGMIAINGQPCEFLAIVIKPL